jgi:hypothetical protein
MYQKLSRAGNASGAPDLWKSGQNLGLFREDRIHLAGRANVVTLNECEHLTSIGSRGPSPNQIHHADLDNFL